MTKTLRRLLILCLAIAGAALCQKKNTAMMLSADHFTEMRALADTSLRVNGQRVSGVSPDYKLATGDFIAVEVLAADSLSGAFEVGKDGTIRMAYIGDISVGGKTSFEVEEEIGKRYFDDHLIRNAEVLVRILEYRGKPYYVYGEVDFSGQYMMSQRLTLLDAILVAGGLKGPAADFGYLHRKATDSSTILAPAPELLLANPGLRLAADREVVKVDLRPLKQGRLLEEDVVLEEGDVFVVPSKKFHQFYVIGEVARPGAFELSEEQTVFAGQGVAQAGGPMKTAKVKDGVLIRMNDAGERTERPVDFRALLTGKMPDFPLQNNDVLFIPGSGSKTLAYGLLGSMPSRAQQSISDATR